MTDISVANCDRVTMNMASLAGHEAIRKLTIENVSDLRLKPGSDRYNTLPEPESSKPKSTNGLRFRAKNVTVKGEMVRNTFCGEGFDVIGMKLC